jgi:hypothetical protein
VNLLQRHAALRRLLVMGEQFVCAAIIYTGAALAWRALTGGHGRPGLVTVLAATLVVALVLSWTRPTFERAVNWLAFGERADGYELAAGFLERLATGIEIDDVLPRLAETAARTVGSRRGEVRVWLADGGSWRQTWPVDAAAISSDAMVEVRHGGDRVGEMIVGLPATEMSASERRLLEELAGPAGLALSTVRLTHSLRQRAAEIELTAAQIQASRARIVDARRGEQDRIRDQLATRIRPELRAASEGLTGNGSLNPVTLSTAASHVSRAVDELRQLARGLYPARLAEAGPVEALRGWTEVQNRRITVSVAGDPGQLTDPADLAAAVYFCAVTALSGTTGDGSVTFAIGEEDVTLELAADPNLNPGLPPACLQAVSDRAQAFGGEAVAWPAGSAPTGTAVVAGRGEDPAGRARADDREDDRADGGEHDRGEHDRGEHDRADDPAGPSLAEAWATLVRIALPLPTGDPR